MVYLQEESTLYLELTLEGQLYKESAEIELSIKNTKLLVRITFS